LCVRGSLSPLQALAAEMGLCVVMVTHLNKGTDDGAAMSRVAGSGAYVAACRSAWFVAKHPQDADRRILTPLKNNIGDDKTGFAYSIEGVGLANDIATSRVVFGETVEISADEALAASRPTPEEDSALGEACEFLRDYLAGGPQTAKAATDAARKAAISERTLRRARERLNIRPRKLTGAGPWAWALPNDQPGQRRPR
jgi:putative DNA primase/helicase